MANEFIYGVLEYCFNGIPIIRGYASYKTLINLSEAHPAYQREAEDKHVQEIEEFLESSKIKFMPEIILSYDCVGLWQKAEDWQDPYLKTPIEYLYNSAGYLLGPLTLNDYKTDVKFQRIRGGNNELRIIKISVPKSFLLYKKTIFRRIDGNHRLQALEKYEFEDYKIPYCIVLISSSGSENLHDREQDEMEVFHNINSKAKPLSLIEQYNGLFNLFTIEELKSYGEEFSITKAYLKKHADLRFNNMSNIIKEKEVIVLDAVKLLINRGYSISEDDIADVLSKLEHTYFDEFSEIKNCKNQLALIPYIFYCYEGEKQNNAKLSAYNSWFIKNRLYDVSDIDPESLIEVFNKIYDIRQKQVFVAMPFKEELEFVFNAICDTVEKINRENGTQLSNPIRIDKQIVGFSYDIVNEILDNIKNAGLLIADLTEQNANVYYEAGFAQGLLKAKLGNAAEILYLISNPENPEEPFTGAKFDIQHYKMIPYSNDGNGVIKLKENLEKELKAFYSI